MTALAIVAKEPLNEFGLQPWQDAFGREFQFGEHALNATRSMLSVRPDYKYERASVEASVLLKDSKMIAFLRHLREQERSRNVKQARTKIQELVPKALEIVERGLDGEVRSRLQAEFAWDVLDRAGVPKTVAVEQDVGERLDSLIKQVALARSERSESPAEVSQVVWSKK